MPVRLPFTVVACTGEDPDYSCRELQYNAPESRGWCTPRYCQYPQEFVVKLDQPAHLFQLQLLSHEFKIAAKVEIHVGMLPEGAQDLSMAQWKRLGHLSFDSNERSQLSARELKSVVLNGVPAQLVRFQFARCHMNRLNLYAQVGIIALNLIGDPIGQPLATITNTASVLPATSSLASMNLGGGPTWAPPPVPEPAPGLVKSVSNAGSSGAVALAAELNVDVVTAQKMLDLQEKKKQAIESEDYDEAKRLKSSIDRLRAVGTKIAQLDVRKKAAVEQEDYDLAKELKLEIDKLRTTAYTFALSGEGSAAGDTYNSFKSPIPSRRGSMSGAGPAAQRATEALDDISLPQPQASSRETSLPEPGSSSSSAAAAAAQAAAQRSRAAPLENWANYDERPAQAKGMYQFDGSSVAEELPAPGSRRTSIPTGGRASRGGDGGPAPPGFPADLPAPEPLTPADAKDAQPLMDLLGDYTTRAMFSKTWQLREAALQKIGTDIVGGRLEGLDGNSDAFKALARGMARMVKDKVAGVFQASLKVLRELVGCQATRCHARDVQTAVGELLPLLIEKASDLNTRIKEQATEMLVYLASVKEAGLPSNTYPIVKPVKSQAAWKVVLGRLQLLSALLPVVGMASGRGAGGEGFQLDAVMEFVGAAFGNSSAEVRAAAVQLTLQVFDVVGPSVQRYLPADLNPKVKEQIEQGMLNRPPAGMPVGLPRTSVAAAAASNLVRAAPPKSAAPKKAAPAAAAAGGSAGTGAALAAQQSPAQQGSIMYPPSPGSPGMPAGGEDDPALFEAELRAREARLGSSHPDVAEALSNLAIIYNQRGDTAKALPLYERALAIWEATCGQDHPDVAHTLTDIAVIHLEQGRDDIGRPLLERALAIQEKHLGPDHPDVVAIRDVLNEEA